MRHVNVRQPKISISCVVQHVAFLVVVCVDGMARLYIKVFEDTNFGMGWLVSVRKRNERCILQTICLEIVNNFEVEYVMKVAGNLAL